MSLDSLLGHGPPVVVTLGYHRCPMLCGLVLDGLAKAAKTVGLTLGKDYTAVDISIDPGEDTKLLQKNQYRVLEQAGQGLGKPPPAPTGRSGSPRPTAARRPARSPMRSVSDTSTTRRRSSSPTKRSLSC